MADFVLVPGAFHGAWAWEPVAALLRARGHRAFPIDLTGQGSKRDLVSPLTNLSTHISDVVQVMTDHELRDVVLVGHSYGGMVVTGVADRMRGRVQRLVYADAMVPGDGQSAEDVAGPEVTQVALAAAAGDWLVSNFFPITKFGPFADNLAEQGFAAMLVPHPLASFFEKLHLSGPLAVDQSFISSTIDPMSMFEPAAARAKDSPLWRYYEVNTGHDAMLTEPALLTNILLEISQE